MIINHYCHPTSSQGRFGAAPQTERQHHQHHKPDRHNDDNDDDDNDADDGDNHDDVEVSTMISLDGNANSGLHRNQESHLSLASVPSRKCQQCQQCQERKLYIALI